MRVVSDLERPRGRAGEGPGRGRVRVRRRHRLRRALPAARPPRRGAGHGRHARHRAGSSATATARSSAATRRSSRRRPRRTCPTPSARRCTTRPAPPPRPSTTSAPAPSSSSSTATGVFFLEMNTRLQVEHPVTEEVFGVDLVAAQIAVAEGRPLGASVAAPHGHAIEVRLYAEDPADDWSPQTGTVRTFEFPDRCASTPPSRSGSVVGIHYDAMIAKVVAHGPDRATALRTLGRRAAPHARPRRHDQPSTLRAILEAPRCGRRPAHLAARGARRRLVGAEADRSAGRRWRPPSPRPRIAAASARVLEPHPGRLPQRPEPAAHPRVRGSRARRVPQRCRAASASTTPTVVSIDASGPTPTVVLDVDGVTETLRGRGRPTGTSTSTARTARSSLTPVPLFVDPADVVAEGSLLAPMPAAVIASRSPTASRSRRATSSSSSRP